MSFAEKFAGKIAVVDKDGSVARSKPSSANSVQNDQRQTQQQQQQVHGALTDGYSESDASARGAYASTSLRTVSTQSQGSDAGLMYMPRSSSRQGGGIPLSAAAPLQTTASSSTASGIAPQRVLTITPLQAAAQELNELRNDSAGNNGFIVSSNRRQQEQGQQPQLSRGGGVMEGGGIHTTVPSSSSSSTSIQTSRRPPTHENTTTTTTAAAAAGNSSILDTDKNTTRARTSSSIDNQSELSDGNSSVPSVSVAVPSSKGYLVVAQQQEQEQERRHPPHQPSSLAASSNSGGLRTNSRGIPISSSASRNNILGVESGGIQPGFASSANGGRIISSGLRPGMGFASALAASASSIPSSLSTQSSSQQQQKQHPVSRGQSAENSGNNRLLSSSQTPPINKATNANGLRAVSPMQVLSSSSPSTLSPVFQKSSIPTRQQLLVKPNPNNTYAQIPTTAAIATIEGAITNQQHQHYQHQQLILVDGVPSPSKQYESMQQRGQVKNKKSPRNTNIIFAQDGMDEEDEDLKMMRMSRLSDRGHDNNNNNMNGGPSYDDMGAEPEPEVSPLPKLPPSTSSSSSSSSAAAGMANGRARNSSGSGVIANNNAKVVRSHGVAEMSPRGEISSSIEAPNIREVYSSSSGGGGGSSNSNTKRRVAPQASSPRRQAPANKLLFGNSVATVSTTSSPRSNPTTGSVNNPYNNISKNFSLASSSRNHQSVPQEESEYYENIGDAEYGYDGQEGMILHDKQRQPQVSNQSQRPARSFDSYPREEQQLEEEVDQQQSLPMTNRHAPEAASRVRKPSGARKHGAGAGQLAKSRPQGGGGLLPPRVGGIFTLPSSSSNATATTNNNNAPASSGLHSVAGSSYSNNNNNTSHNINSNNYNNNRGSPTSYSYAISSSQPKFSSNAVTGTNSFILSNIAGGGGGGARGDISPSHDEAVAAARGLPGRPDHRSSYFYVDHGGKRVSEELNARLVKSEQDQLAYSRKARAVHYTPHTLADYKAARESLGMGMAIPSAAGGGGGGGGQGGGNNNNNFNGGGYSALYSAAAAPPRDTIGVRARKGAPVGYHELGSLGPDLGSDEIQQAKAARQRQRSYAADVVAATRQRQSLAQAKGERIRMLQQQQQQQNVAADASHEDMGNYNTIDDESDGIMVESTFSTNHPGGGGGGAMFQSPRGGGGGVGNGSSTDGAAPDNTRSRGRGNENGSHSPDALTKLIADVRVGGGSGPTSAAISRVATTNISGPISSKDPAVEARARALEARTRAKEYAKQVPKPVARPLAGYNAVANVTDVHHNGSGGVSNDDDDDYSYGALVPPLHDYGKINNSSNQHQQRKQQQQRSAHLTNPGSPLGALEAEHDRLRNEAQAIRRELSMF